MGRTWGRGASGVGGRCLSELWGPVGVVVLDVVGDESFELRLVPDDRAVEEFAA